VDDVEQIIPASVQINTLLDDRRHTDATGHSLALQIVLLHRTYVLPWSQFLYAEGGNDEVRLTFATHDVLVKGGNLNPLIAALAIHGITRLQEPIRPDRFEETGGPVVREISVREIEQNQ
jgi:hypothetical protein